MVAHFIGHLISASGGGYSVRVPGPAIVKLGAERRLREIAGIDGLDNRTVVATYCHKAYPVVYKWAVAQAGLVVGERYGTTLEPGRSPPMSRRQARLAGAP